MAEEEVAGSSAAGADAESAGGIGVSHSHESTEKGGKADGSNSNDNGGAVVDGGTTPDDGGVSAWQHREEAERVGGAAGGARGRGAVRAPRPTLPTR